MPSVKTSPRETCEDDEKPKGVVLKFSKSPIELTKIGFAELSEFSDIYLQLYSATGHRYIEKVFFKLTPIIHLSDSLNSLDVLLNAKVHSSFMFIHTTINTKYFSVDEGNCSIQKKCKTYLNLTSARWPQLTFQIFHSKHEANEQSSK